MPASDTHAGVALPINLVSPSPPTCFIAVSIPQGRQIGPGKTFVKGLAETQVALCRVKNRCEEVAARGAPSVGQGPIKALLQ